MIINNGTIIAFSVVGGVGTFSSSVYYTIRAYRNKTGPTISPGKHMRDYSGHFEMDMLPAFVNLVTALQYLGETMETIENRFGFFSQYRYGSYMITCPLMVYELIHTIGAPYATTLFALTLFTIMTALFADCAPEPSSRWAWFTIGCLLNTLSDPAGRRAPPRRHVGFSVDRATAGPCALGRCEPCAWRAARRVG